jgi:hypothetical protein
MRGHVSVACSSAKLFSKVSCSSAKLSSKVSWIDPGSECGKSQSTVLPHLVAASISHQLMFRVVKRPDDSKSQHKSAQHEPAAPSVAPAASTRAPVAPHDCVADFQCSDWFAGAAKAAKLPTDGQPGLCFVVSLDGDEAQVLSAMLCLVISLILASNSPKHVVGICVASRRHDV